MRFPTLLSLTLFVLSGCTTPTQKRAKNERPMNTPPPLFYSSEQVHLPQVDHALGVSLMQALKNRKSDRAFSPKALPPALLSGLLWAANGINRANGKRTSPTLWPMEIYVALPQGLYLWEAKTNTLTRKLAQDIRALTGNQLFTQQAPATLIYVLDYATMTNPWLPKLGGKAFFAGNAAGYVSQNVYLYAAAQNLATVAIASFDQEALAAKMGLQPSKRILLTQPVGFPSP